MRGKLLAAVSVSLLTTCGGQDFSRAPGNGEGPPRTAQTPPPGPCEPVPAEVPPDWRNGRRVQLRQPLLIPIGKDAGPVELTVQGAQQVQRIEDRFTDKGEYRVASGNQFLAVFYSFANRGRAEVEAANTVNKNMLAVVSDGQGWNRSDGAATCRTVSASAASLRPRTVSPETDVAPGDGYASVVVYTLPRDARDVSLVGFGHRLELPKPSKASAAQRSPSP